MNRKAVSLAEVLLVLIILVFLAAVLFPVFFKGKECSHCSNCSSNEKQIGLAFAQYAQDNDMTLPSGLTGQGDGWGGQVYPYLKSTGVFRCPEDSAQARGTLAPMSYAYSRNLALRPRVPLIILPNLTVEAFEVQGTFADVTQPDEGVAQGASALSPSGDGTPGNLTAGPAGRPALALTRHTSGANYLLVDGHVRYYIPNQMSVGGDALSVGSLATPSTAASVWAISSGKAPYKASFSRK